MKILDRENGIALWRQIAEDLADAIDRGHPASGEKLAPEKELARQYGVNRHTIRQAIKLLVNDGLVRVEHGRGTFVQKRLAAFSLDAGRPHSHSLRAMDLLEDHEFLGIGLMRADEKQAQGLEVQAGDKLAFVESLGRRDGMALLLSKSFFPVSRCPDILEKIERLKSVCAALDELGYRNTSSSMTRLTAELPGKEVATKLAIAPSRPVLKVIRLKISAAQEPLAFTMSYFSGDLCQLTF